MNRKYRYCSRITTDGLDRAPHRAAGGGGRIGGHYSCGAGITCVIVCVEVHTMATNLSIDPQLLVRALQGSGERTKKAAVTKALQEFIDRRRQKRLLELMGKLDWDSSYDYKAERARG